MRKFFLISLSVIFVVIGVFIIIQRNSSDNSQISPTLPDYTKWSIQSKENIPFLVKGETVSLYVEAYTHRTEDSVSFVVVWHNVDAKPWFLAYQIYEQNTQTMKTYIFEQKESKWTLVKEFPDGALLDVMNFLTKTYNITGF